MPSEESRCARCGQDRAKHHLANYADGPFVGQALLICPAAVFESYIDQAVRVLKHQVPANRAAT